MKMMSNIVRASSRSSTLRGHGISIQDHGIRRVNSFPGIRPTMISNNNAVIHVVRMISSLSDPYENEALAKLPKSAKIVSDTYFRNKDESEFVKMIRKPPDFFNQIIEGLKAEFREVPKIQDLSSTQAKMRSEIHSLLTEEERNFYLKTIYTNIAFSKPISANFAKSALALPTMGSSVYSHMFAGIVNYVDGKNKKKADLKSSPLWFNSMNECMAAQHTGHLGLVANNLLKGNGASSDLPHHKYAHLPPHFYRAPISLATYYRTPILMEELARFGLSEEESYRAVAKAFFVQYWSGDYRQDTDIFNPLIRVYYPQGKHLITGANDLGRETEFQAAKLFAQGLSSLPAHGSTPDSPVCIINFGDSGPFTDGFIHAVQHILEASERGIKMPIIFLVNANNSSISTRLAFEDPEQSVQKIVDRFESFGNLFSPGIVVEAEDVPGGMREIRNCVDRVLETGKPTYCICSYPFRPLGHASDGHPGADPFLLYQFDTFKETLFDQIYTAETLGKDGNEVADEIQRLSTLIDASVKYAMSGDNQLDRATIRELSTPGITSIVGNEMLSQTYDLPLDYMLNKTKKKGGLGNEIYARMVDRVMSLLDAEQRECRYVHQENHQPNTNDTRGGVYGELNNIRKEYLLKNFVSFLPQEAQVAQIGAALRVVLPEKNVVFVKGPHTIFNEHARDHIKYAAFRHYDSGEMANYIYIVDGGSLAARDKEKIQQMSNPESVLNGKYDKQHERDIILARVGEHHNTNEYSSYSGDPNTICVVPIDMNHLDLMMGNLIKLHDLGRMVIVFAPTASFGLLHPKIEVSKAGDSDITDALRSNLTNGITQNDIIRIKIDGVEKPKNGKKLIVVTWGPDSKWVSKELKEAHRLDCEQIILSYVEAPKELINYLGSKTQNEEEEYEVMLVDPNPRCNLFAPVMTQVKIALNYPKNILFSECTVLPSFVPYGLGKGLLGASDLMEALKTRGILEGGSGCYVYQGTTNASIEVSTASNSSSGEASAGEEILYAPMEAETVLFKFQKKVGDAVKADELILELETDKAGIEITSPIDGILTELYVNEDDELDVTEDTRICRIVAHTSSSAHADGVSSAVSSTTGSPTNTVSSGSAATSTSGNGGSGELLALSKVQQTMIKNMTVMENDTLTFGVSEQVSFAKLIIDSKSNGVSPTTTLIKKVAEAIKACEVNKKLYDSKKMMLDLNHGRIINLGLAMEKDSQLRVVLLKDVLNKTETEIKEEIETMKDRKLSLEDQDMSEVCFVLSTLGKSSPLEVNPTLPRGMTGIIGVGRINNNVVKVTMNCCHATLNGSEGARLILKLKNLCES